MCKDESPYSDRCPSGYGRDPIFRDRDLAGFGVRVHPSGQEGFVIRTRALSRTDRIDSADTDGTEGGAWLALADTIDAAVPGGEK